MKTESEMKEQIALNENEEFKIGYRIGYEEEREIGLSITAEELRKRGWAEAHITDLIQAVRKACDPETTLEKRTEKAFLEYLKNVRESWYSLRRRIRYGGA